METMSLSKSFCSVPAPTVVATSSGNKSKSCHSSGLSYRLRGSVKGIRSASCSFLSGNGINFFRHVVQAIGKSKASGGALSCTCDYQKILIANRGEIAVRVIRTAHEMGIPCVAVHSTVDKQALHVQIADEAVCIGEAPSSQSYLVIPNIVAAAVSRGCTMLHPGYGFLSENASFVDICKEHGINFIGPSPDSIRVMGDKATARETMKKAGVPTVPGSDGLLESTEEAITVANQIGFPVMIKATAGGGGRGMRLANEPGEFVKLLQQAKSEAGAAFGLEPMQCMRSMSQRRIRRTLEDTRSRRRSLLQPLWVVVGMHFTSTMRRRKIRRRLRKPVASIATISSKHGHAALQ